MVQNTNDNIPEPQIRVSKMAYTVWILPFIALVLAMWLIYKNFTNAGIIIHIAFNDANGIVATKTVVRFRGIEVGRCAQSCAAGRWHWRLGSSRNESGY